MDQIIAQIQQQLAGGAKFNGIVYNKYQGKHHMVLFIYLDGKYTKIAHVSKEDAAATKAEILATLTGASSPSAQKTPWTVNGKEIHNTLTYEQMWDKYGTDFE